MTPLTPAFDATSLIIAGAACAFGLLLLVLGLRGRRVGSEPRCRKCGYNLTGTTSQFCSECGRTIDNRGVVFGARRRMRIIIVLSLLIVAAAGTFGGLDGYRQLQKVDKYRYYPFSWLIDGGHAGDLAALKELDRRVRADKLSSKQLQRIIADALAEQSSAASAGSTSAQEWVNMLNILSHMGQLTDPQLHQYFDQCRTYSLVARPKVRIGDSVPVAIVYQSFGPDWRASLDDQYWPVTASVPDVLLANQSPDVSSTESLAATPIRFGCMTGFEGFGTTGSCGPTPATFILNGAEGPGNSQISPPPGSYSIVGDMIEQIRPLNKETPLRTRTVRLTAQFEVLPHDAPDTVVVVAQPELADQIRAALNLETLECELESAWRYKMRVILETGLVGQTATLLPMDLAFDVYVRIIGAERRLGSVVFRAGSSELQSVFGNAPPLSASSADIVLRSSIDAARSTVDIFEIWDGEIIFESVPIKHIYTGEHHIP